MSWSIVFDVVMGIVFVFFVVSALISWIQEGIATLLRLRAKTLEAFLQSMLQKGDTPDAESQVLIQSFYDHELIKSLRTPARAWRYGGFQKSKGNDAWRKPSYIPARQFAAVLMEFRLTKPNLLPPAVSKIIGIEQRKHGAGLNERISSSLEDWFNDTMDRATGWYKKRVWLMTLLIGLVIVGAFNIDAIGVADAIWKDAGIRSQIVTAASTETGDAKSDDSEGNESTPTTPATTTQPGYSPTEAASALAVLPLGWNQGVPHTWAEAIYKAIGLLTTIFAVSFGSSFWFDTLSRFMNIRGTGKKPDGQPAGD